MKLIDETEEAPEASPAGSPGLTNRRTVKIEEDVYERTDQIRWKTGHLAPRAYAEGPPVRPPGSPPEAAKRKAAKMRASGQHWGTW